MQLSPHFTLAELTRSETAQRYQIDNTPDAGGIAKLQRVAETILEPVRKHFGRPVIINSGYRSVAVNRRVPGSSNTSQHTLCEAVDFEVPGFSNYEVALWCTKNLPDWGQIILEFYTLGQPSSGWVHCSLRSATKHKQILTAKRVNGRTSYMQGLVA